MATRYFINGGTNSNWSNSKNWSLASGGTGNAGVPTASINVIFDNNSPNCIIDSLTSSNCLALTFTSYSNIITFNNNLGVYGNLILGSGMSFSGTSSMIIAGSASITSNGKPIGVPLIFDPLVSSLGFVLNIDTVLNDDLILDNDLNIGVQISPSLAQLAINGNSVYINSNLYMNSGNGILDGVITNSANLIFSGSGTYSFQGSISNNIQFNCGNSILIGYLNFYGSSIQHIGGNVDAITNFPTLALVSDTTLDVSGILWWYIECDGYTITLNSQLNVINKVSYGSTYNGDYGFSASNYSSPNGYTTFLNGPTYSASNSFIMVGSNLPNNLALCSMFGQGGTVFIIGATAAQYVAHVEISGMDFSYGATLYAYSNPNNSIFPIDYVNADNAYPVSIPKSRGFSTFS